MTVAYKICVDCVDPHRLAAFWAEAMGYVVEDHSALISFLLDNGQVTEAAVTTVDGRRAWRHAAGIRDPDGPVDPRTGVGLSSRMLFQVVPEGKPAEPTSDGASARAHNKVHLDLHVGPERRAEVVERLLAAGATKLWDGEQGGSTWVTLADPEGNEFCVA